MKKSKKRFLRERERERERESVCEWERKRERGEREREIDRQYKNTFVNLFLTRCNFDWYDKVALVHRISPLPHPSLPNTFIKNKSTQQNTKQTNETHLSEHLWILRINVSRENFHVKIVSSIIRTWAAFLPTTCFSHTGKLNFKSVVCWFTIKKKKTSKSF